MKGFVRHKPLWLVRPLGLDEVRKYAADDGIRDRALLSQGGARRRATPRCASCSIELAEAEDKHEDLAEKLDEQILTKDARARRTRPRGACSCCNMCSPGLAGLMDGSVSTLAPLFAAAFATHNTWETFLVGMAASVGAGISMGFAEALSDDGSLTGRGAPLLRGAVCGAMTALGGLGHTLPYLIPDFWTATVVAVRRRCGRARGRSPTSAPLHGHAVPRRRRSRSWSAACWCSSPGS